TAISSADAPAVSPVENKTGDELLIDAARKLGIFTQGKTREQIQEEIIKMAQAASPKAPPDDAKAPSSL
ncbi:MAG: hypothetical protein OK455_05025, partial [Thaumarchaeota archaeon]|nr:hypothetical protein [Nitrososphaerota archaeon]